MSSGMTGGMTLRRGIMTLVQRQQEQRMTGFMAMAACSCSSSLSPLHRRTSLLPFPPACRLMSTSQYLCRTLPSSLSSDHHASGSAAHADGATSKAERTRKRFWKDVDVAYVEANGAKPAHLVVRLDGRGLKTPSGALLAVPTNRPLLASLIAREWAEQDKVLHQHSLPMTSIAARAIDGMETEARRTEIVDALVEYLHTETICFHESHPPALVQLQNERWKPILEWTRTRFGTPPIKIFDDIFGVKQDDGVVQRLRQHVNTYDGFDLAALERMVRSTKSFLIGLRLVEALRSQRASDEAAFGVNDAALAADVEVESQTQRWGEVEDTHDVDYADIRKILGSAACALVRDSDEAARGIAKEVVRAAK